MLYLRIISSSLRRIKNVPQTRALCTLHVNSNNYTNKYSVGVTNDLLFKNISEYNNNLCSVLKRFKSKQKSKKIQEDLSDDEESEDDSDDEDESLKNSKIVETSVKSLRLDLVLKAGLGMSRNKVDTAFYESRVRKNGQKVFKKSDMLDIDDEIDLVMRTSPDNPNFLVVKRIKLLSVKPVMDTFRIKVAKDKQLLIENYDSEPWQSSQ